MPFDGICLSGEVREEREAALGLRIEERAVSGIF